MKPMLNESVVLESQGKSLILTTHRIRYQSEALGNAEIRSIMLEELASCAIVHSSNVILLILAGICFLGGFLFSASARAEGPLIVGVLLAVILVVVYFASRRQVLALGSAGTTISVNTQGIKLDWLKEFIDQAEAAKNARYLIGRG
jgi:hypothetical protein